MGDVVAFNGLLLLFGFPTFAGQWAYSRVASGLASARRILELINAETELDQNVAGHEAPIAGRGGVRGRQLLLPPARPRPAPASQPWRTSRFRAAPGQTVAIVGQTGSGKSTIAKLINRTYDADDGRVLVDGVDVRDWNLEALRRQISIIEQDIFLFSRTHRREHRLWQPGRHAARRSKRRPGRPRPTTSSYSFKDGYDTVVGERGVTLSGGQRQRIALARAFLTEPRILILDDSTSAIDSATEDRIQRAIEQAGPEPDHVPHHPPPVADPPGRPDRRHAQGAGGRHRHPR